MDAHRTAPGAAHHPLCTSILLMILILAPVACAPKYRSPDLGKLYNDLAQYEDPTRNPVIVIPGILGSRLVQRPSGNLVWGAFGLGQVNPNTPEGARLIALPMRPETPLADLADDVTADGALDRVVINFMGYPIQLNAYYHILQVLGVGGYRDQGLGEAGAIDYGDRHFTCFQFDYDWRRDIVESARQLDRFIKAKLAYVQQERLRRFGIKPAPTKFDIVAHSMGSLVARYYARYGTQDLPADGSLPPVTWEGTKYIEHLIMIGPPNAGSLSTLQHLVQGIKPAAFFPKYPAAVVGTMPSVYQLLPRTRHKPLIDNAGRAVEDIFDPGLWRHHQWGLADPDQAPVLQMLLPHVSDPEERRQIALAHLTRCLHRANQFTAALDRPARPPNSLRLFLVAGDSVDTARTVRIDADGRLIVVQTGPGDGTVLRTSALMDERPPGQVEKRLVSPIHWQQVLFLFSDHLGLTKDPAFTDNILYFLLEQPRP